MAPSSSPSNPYFVYLLRCSDGSFYAGITTDPERRLREHNGSDKGAKYTRARRPVQLTHSETWPDRASALRRERVIKRYSHLQKEYLHGNPDSEASDLGFMGAPANAIRHDC